MEQKFKTCSICGDKINFFRRRIAKKQDKKGTFHLTQQQFCSPKCSIIGEKILSEITSVQQDERTKLNKLLDETIDMINKRRQAEIQKYGSIENIPQEVRGRLYIGSISLLNNIKKKLNETERS